MGEGKGWILLRSSLEAAGGRGQSEPPGGSELAGSGEDVYKEADGCPLSVPTMNDFGPLFDAGDRQAPPDSTWSVLALNRAIESALQRAFPSEVWLRGEIQGLARTRMRKHWYFELVEKDPRSDQVLARVSVALLQWNRGAVERDLAAAPGLELDDGVQVRIRCEVGYYAPWGKLQLTMKGIDPAFTLGAMAANRERILRLLHEEGLLRRNAARPLPLLPIRIGLVTSVGSAAYNDFVDELRLARIGWRIEACDARVQGADAERTLCAAIATLERRGCSVIVVVRGGGSRSDLAAFDAESLARRIARTRVPVLTGIGHEIDRSVADEVAHTAFKTPTACAAFLVERARDFLGRLDGVEAAIVDGARHRIAGEEQRLYQVAGRIARGARVAIRAELGSLEHGRNRLRRAARRGPERAGARLRESSRTLRDRVRVVLVHREALLRLALRRLGPDRRRRTLLHRRQLLQAQIPRLRRAARRALQRREQILGALEPRVRAADPLRLLRRGYSLTYDAEGRLLRSVTQTGPGCALRTRLADGQLLGRIESVEPGCEPHQEEGD